MIELVTPDIAYQRSYLDATGEFGGGHRDGDGMWHEDADPTSGYPGHSFTREDLETAEGFTRFVAHRAAAAHPDAPLRPGWVRCTFLWGVEDGAYVGSLAIRHTLNDYLLAQGGHIGYSVRPSARRRGVATAMLRQALPRAKALGIDPVLLTCDEDNAGSRRVIEANGGVYEDTWVDGVLRYWAPTS